jgi:hypothetical protein
MSTAAKRGAQSAGEVCGVRSRCCAVSCCPGGSKGRGALREPGRRKHRSEQRERGAQRGPGPERAEGFHRVPTVEPIRCFEPGIREMAVICRQHCSHQNAPKALGPLASSVRDILVRFAHSDRARAELASGPRPFDPPGQHDTAQHRDRTPHTSPADCAPRFAAVLVPRTAPSRDETLDDARHPDCSVYRLPW